MGSREVPSMHLLHLEDIKFLAIGGGVDNVRGQVATGIKNARRIGQPLAQRQREVGSL